MWHAMGMISGNGRVYLIRKCSTLAPPWLWLFEPLTASRTGFCVCSAFFVLFFLYLITFTVHETHELYEPHGIIQAGPKCTNQSANQTMAPIMGSPPTTHHQMQIYMGNHTILTTSKILMTEDDSNPRRRLMTPSSSFCSSYRYGWTSMYVASRPEKCLSM